MQFITGAITFGAGMMASRYLVPKVAVAVEKMKHDAEVILTDEAIIKQMCVDQIVRWYYDGKLESEVTSILKARKSFDDDMKARFRDLKNGVPFWPKTPEMGY